MSNFRNTWQFCDRTQQMHLDLAHTNATSHGDVSNGYWTSLRFSPMAFHAERSLAMLIRAIEPSSDASGVTEVGSSAAKTVATSS